MLVVASLVHLAHAQQPTKLKILALHGYAQNGAILRDRSGGFRKPFKKSRFEVVYAGGQFGCTANGEDEEEADADETRRAWWRGHSGQDTYVGWGESRAQLHALWARERCDGVLGFSQGAAAAAMLCADLCASPQRPQFGIFVSGFVPRDQLAAEALLVGVSGLPSLHVCGAADELVVSGRSLALAALFTDATVVEHPGGHCLPSGSTVRKEVATWVQGAVLQQE